MFSKRSFRRNKPKQNNWLESSDQKKDSSFIPPIQTKLNIGEPGDVYEQEADKTADAVVNESSSSNAIQKMGDEKEDVQAKGVAGTLTPFVQKKEVQTKQEEEVQKMGDHEEEVQTKEEEEVQSKQEENMQLKCNECVSEEKEEVAQMKEEEEVAQNEEEEVAQRKQEEEVAQNAEEEVTQMKEEEEVAQNEEEEVAQEDKEEMVQNKSKNNTAGLKSNKKASGLESQLSARRGSGDKMDGQTQNIMESSFGNDFSKVRIHTGAYSADMNKQIGARAFTNGNDIYFNSNQYKPESKSGKHLLAHELTHTIQQKGHIQKNVQADYSVAPTTPDRNSRNLSAAQIRRAIAWNQARHTDTTEISLIRDIIGLSKNPAVIDEDFINSLVEYQSQYGLVRDGRMGHGTADRLAKEIQAESDFLGPGNQGSLGPEFAVRDNVQALITANNRVYADYKRTIEAGTMIQRHIALNTSQLLRDLKTQLTWNNWARCIELMGRQIPTGRVMRGNGTVRAAMRVAWNASNPAITRWPTPVVGDPLSAQCNPVAGAPPTTAHEEGGFIYMNLITGRLSTRRVASGGQAGLILGNPPNVANSIVVGGFHTHPNVGNCWGAPFLSGDDINWANNNGVPILMIGAFPAVNNTSFHSGGRNRRHLAGSRGLPGAGGGLAPQRRRY